MRKIYVRSTGINWYVRSVIELNRKLYSIKDVIYDNLLDKWIITI